MTASIPTPWPRGRKEKPRRCSADCSITTAATRDALPADFQEIRLEEGVDRAVCDYIAGMTDPFAIEQFSRLFIPTAWSVK